MEATARLVRTWLEEAGATVRSKLRDQVEVTEKSSRTDLVTNIDKENQAFLVECIQQHFPEDQIQAEENGFDQLTNQSGRAWIIDPIDGTLNFVLERENFCMMMALYEAGQGRLGFIYDVINEKLYWGGPELGLFCNDEPLPTPVNKDLSEGLLGINAFMYAHNIHHAQEIGEASMGVRVSGCAGLEFIAILRGKHIGYLSNLSPWDYAAGNVLLDTIGFTYRSLSHEKLQFEGREYYVGGTPSAMQTMQTMQAK